MKRLVDRHKAHPALHRRGTALILAIVMIFVLSMLVAATTAVLMQGYRARSRAEERCKVLQALEGGLALALAHAEGAGGGEFALTRELGAVPVEVAWRAEGPGRATVEVRAQFARGASWRAAADLELDGQKRWRVVDYAESAVVTMP